MAVGTEISIFWDITTCSAVKVNGISEEYIAFIFRASQARNQHEAGSKDIIFLLCFACYLLHAGFLLGLLFYPEDRGDMFFQNVGLLQWTAWRYIPEDLTLNYH
jgi:hypothetical protein